MELQALRKQYEDHPYPPIPFLALPRRSQGKELRYETGAALAGLHESHEGKRILIAGCGTLETSLIVQNQPHAAEIVAADLSERSIEISRARLRWMRFARPLLAYPPVRFLASDVAQIKLGKFDYIVASNVLHHSPDPARLLGELSKQLKIGGLIRVVTYPKGSRYWMRRTSEWLRSRGFSPDQPDLLRNVRKAIRSLPVGNPIRSCFESQPESRTATGLIDAFFNACENPLSPLEWEKASQEAGFSLFAEAQNENSRSSFLDAFLPAPRALSVWEKLEILDSTWELCANPVFWFQKFSEPHLVSHSPNRSSLAEQICLTETLLKKAGTDLQTYQRWLMKEAGPRVSPRHPGELLRGLSITEYDLRNLDRVERN